MALCVYDGGNAIKANGVSEAACADYLLLSPAEYTASQTQSSSSSLDVTDPAVNELVGGVILLFALSFIFKRIYQFILGK